MVIPCWLFAALAVNTSPVQAQDKVDPNGDSLKGIQKSLDDANKKLDDMKALDSIRADLKTLITNQAGTNLSLESMKGRVKELENQIAGLQKEFEKMQGREVRNYPADRVGSTTG